MRTVAEMQTELASVSKQMADIVANQGELPTAEDQLAMDELEQTSKGLKASIEMAMKAENAHARSEEAKQIKFPRKAEPEQLDTGMITRIPAAVKRYGDIKSFRSDDRYSADAKAYRFGQFVRATLGSDQARNWCLQNGVEIRGAMGEDTNSKGGYLVPGEFSSDLIRLVESRGVFRREARVRPMTQDTLSIPRYSSGTTAYFVGEASAITASDITLDQVQLVAKKLGAISIVSSELTDDAILSVADMLAEDIAYKFADKEDECGFNGDGTSTYGGIVGVRQQLINKCMAGTASGTAAGGVVRYGTGQEYSNIGMDDLTLMISKLPVYAEANAKWYMSKTVWAYILDLMADAGGNTIGTLQQGAAGMTFLGYPVVTVNVMPKDDSQTYINTIVALLGDLKQAASFGDRRMMSMAMSNSAYVGSTSTFETDQIAIRGIERFDINVHDVGSATAAGPIVGLLSHTA